MNPTLARILRSPVLHFALVGGVLFALASAFGIGAGRIGWREEGPDARPAGSRACDAADEPETIRVGSEALVAFVQAQTRMARPEAAASALASAGEATRQDWIDRYVREEALVREARKLGLDRDDELIRRRLVQQMEFLVEDIGEGALTVGEDEIETFYRAHSDEYRRPTTVRFAHVFVRPRGGDEREALERARHLREELDREQIGFDGAHARGDRFLYDRVYVDRTLDEVRSHFGDAFAQAIEKLEPSPHRWIGPVRSSHGFHLVLLIDRRPGGTSTLEEVREAVRETLLREKRDRAVERGVAAIVGRYRVELGRDLPGGSGEPLADPSRVRGPESSGDSRHNIAPPPDS